MIIEPPNDDEIVIPFVDEITEFTKEQYEYIKERLSHPPWFCGCGLKNNHFNERCAKCKTRR